jgi:hypothetical protein
MINYLRSDERKEDEEKMKIVEEIEMMKVREGSLKWCPSILEEQTHG